MRYKLRYRLNRNFNESTNRPAWLSNDLYSFKHRFITDKRDFRMRLKEYYDKSNGLNDLYKGCALENK